MNKTTTSMGIGAAALISGLFGFAGSGNAANLTGDGRDDLVVGATGEALGVGPRSGAAYLMRGYSGGVSSTAVIDQSGLDINELGDEFGSAFASGDFNGDGEADLAIGAPGESLGPAPKSGAVYVYHRTAGELRPATMLDQTGLGINEYGDEFGSKLVAADFNGDGYDDLAVAAVGESFGLIEATGIVYLFLGSPIGLLPVQVIDQLGLGLNEPGDMFGADLAAGDFDRDGLIDLAVGAPGEAAGPGPASGIVYVYRGTSSGLAPQLWLDQTKLNTNEDGDWFGAALTSGDFNDDGYDDLAVGTPGETLGTEAGTGAVYVYRGSKASLAPRQVISQAELDYHESGDEFGWALTSGDYNGDGRDDLAVGAPGENLDNGPDAGAVYIYRGDKNWIVPLQAVTQDGMGTDEPYDMFGASLSSGNYLGDTRIDLAIGAPGEARYSDAPSGTVYLTRGTSLGLVPVREVDQGALGVNEAGDMFGMSLLDK